MLFSKKISTAIDIGGTKISGIAYIVDKDQKIEILSSCVKSSSGFIRGEIINLESLESHIMKVIYYLESEIGSTIDNVDIAISCYFKSFFVNHSVIIEDALINQSDIDSLVKKTKDKFDNKEYEIIHYDVIEFLVNNKKVENPKGIVGKKLACVLHIIVIPTLIVNNLRALFKKFNIIINNILPPVLGMSYAYLPSNVKKNGGILFDIGGYSSSFVIFLNNKVIYTHYLPLGASLVTDDISKVLSVDTNIAEKLKIMFGTLIQNIDRNQLINFSIFNHSKLNNKNVTLGELSDIIEARILEIFEMLSNNYNNLNINSIINQNIYLSGGGSLTAGIDNIFKQVFKHSISYAKMRTPYKNLKNYNKDLASLIGIGIYQSESLFGKSNGNPKNILFSILEWIKSNI